MNQTALDIINKCYETKDTFLDLGRLGLTDEDFVVGSELDLALGLCTHVEKIVFSNEWMGWDKDDQTWKNIETINLLESNFFRSLPPSLIKLSRLYILILAGRPGKTWEIGSMEFIKNFPSLKNLNLSYNKISEIKGLENCSALESLNLSGNQITEIKGLENCTALTSLNLQENKIARIKGLDNCIDLINFILFKNKVTQIKGIENCTALSSLNLSLNKITEIKGLENCTALTYIELGANKISEIKGLENCTAITWIGLFGNKITEIKGLDNCTALTELELSSNQITEIKGLENCSLLHSLYLSDNQIVELKGLKKLKNLRNLYLGNNKIATIQNLNKLPKLGNINLSENPISNLKDLPQLLKLESLEELNLFRIQQNDLNIPIELFGQSAEDNCLEPLRGYFASLRKGSFQFNEVPIILVGNSTAGKTSLRYFLRENVYPPPENHSTHGIEPDLWVPDDELFEQNGISKPQNLQLYIWDFGGQEYYHATHRLFYSQRAIYILVWEGKTNKQAMEETEIQIKHHDGSIEKTKLPLELFPYEYWLQGIRYLTKSYDETPVILLQNKIDQPGNGAEIVLEGKMLGENNCTPFQISVEQAHHINGLGNTDPRTTLLLQQIFKEANHLAMRIIRGQIWSDIKKMLQDVREENIWTPERFLAGMREFDPVIQENSMISYLLQLRELGYIKYVYEDDFLKKYIFINPGWVTEMIYSILDRSVLEKKGEFDKVHVVKKTGEAYADVFIALMKRFELIFYNEEKEVFIAPQYLPDKLEDKPKLNELKAKFKFENTQPGLALQFQSFMPRYIMVRALVAFGEQAIGKYYWKNGMAFTVDNCAVLLLSHYDTKQFRLYIEDANRYVERLVFEKLVSLVDNKTGLALSVNGSSFVTYSNLSKEYYGEKPSGNPNIQAEDESWVPVGQFGHLFGDKDKLKGKHGAAKMEERKIFVSYAWGGESEKMVDDIETRFAIKGIKLTRDKRDLGFKGLVSEFMKNIGEGEAVVAVISDKYLKSPYCMFELLEIYRNPDFKNRIFPIVVGDANIYEPISRLQYFKYWKGKKTELEEAILEVGIDAITMIGDDYKTYKKIFDNIGEIVTVLTDINALNPEMHSAENFETLISSIKAQLNVE